MRTNPIRLHRRISALLCLLIATVLAVPRFAPAETCETREGASRLLTLPSGPSQFQANRTSQRLDHARQHSTTSPFLISEAASPAVNRNRGSVAFEQFRPHSTPATHRQSGRSPPPAIS